MRIHIPLFALLVTSPSYAAIQNPPVFKNIPTDDNTVVEINLDVNFKTGQLYNPKTNKLDNVKLRQYIDPNNPLPNQFVAPTIKVKQKQTLQVNLRNHLPPYKDEKGNVIIDPQNPDKSKCLAPHNTIGCINTTNLHTHGLHVSPNKSASGKTSDDIFVRLEPSIDSLVPTVQKYEYDIENHPAGLFWYHAHLHGSTALQVTSGMAGALVVEGKLEPKFNGEAFTQKGDFDVLWTAKKEHPRPNKVSADENNDLIMVFQQIQYLCGNENNYKLNCRNSEIGKVEGDFEFTGNDDSKYNLLGPQGWKKSGRYTSINGNVLGQINLMQNEFYRWRMIHGGVRDTIGLKIFKLKSENTPLTSLNPTDPANNQVRKSIQEQCENQAKKHPNLLDYFIIAQDGITTNKIQNSNFTVLQPGYRYDALMQFTDSGTYCLVDSELPKSSEINRNLENDTPNIETLHYQTLGWVNVTKQQADSKNLDVKSFLIEKAKIAFPNVDQYTTKEKIIKDLNNGKLNAFAPYENITDDEVLNQYKIYEQNTKLIQNNPYQELTFTIEKKPDNKGNWFGVGNKKNNPTSAKPYDENDKDHTRFLALDTFGEWTLTSKSSLGEIGHPFHIHVNPFQIHSIYQLNNKGERKKLHLDLLDPKKVSEELKQFINLNGIWKDTLFVPAGYEIIVRTKYEHFTGDFVLHCHILDHEDQGMMQNVRICKKGESYEDCSDFTKNPFPHREKKNTTSHSH